MAYYLTVTTFDPPIPTRRTSLGLSIGTVEQYRTELSKRYRSGTASSRRRWEAECRKFGWRYEQRQFIDDNTMVVWRYEMKHRYRRRVYQIVETEAA